MVILPSRSLSLSNVPTDPTVQYVSHISWQPHGTNLH